MSPVKPSTPLSPDTIPSRLPPETWWQALGELAQAMQHNDLAAALQAILSAGQRLTEAEMVAFYLAASSTPELTLMATAGDASIFPVTLPAQELISLRQPDIWRQGRHPTAALHRLGLTHSLIYVASTLVGRAGAATGLLALAGQQRPPAAHLMPAASLLATHLTITLESHLQRTYLLQELQSARLEHCVQEALENQINEGLLLSDPGLRLIRMNSAAEQILGFANREVIGQPVEKVLVGYEALFPALAAAQQGFPSFGLEEHHLYRRNGEAFPALIRIFPIQECQDSVQAIVILIQDMSERERARLQTQQLEHHALLGEVTASFAHEVRNPINNISTGLQLLAMNLPPEDPNQTIIARHLQDCDRLAELVKSVLAFSRPIDYEMENMALGEVLQRLLERLHARLTRQNIQYSLFVAPDCPAVLGNFRALEQVFSNLINNAAKAMEPEGGTLALRVQPIASPEGNTYVEASVADTGPGIPKEIIDRIFQPFFTTHREGTGLGLAIAKRIITAHKGTLQVTSFPGGTVFYVRLPAISTPTH